MRGLGVYSNPVFAVFLELTPPPSVLLDQKFSTCIVKPENLRLGRELATAAPPVFTALALFRLLATIVTGLGFVFFGWSSVSVGPASSSAIISDSISLGSFNMQFAPDS